MKRRRLLSVLLLIFSASVVVWGQATRLITSGTLPTNCSVGAVYVKTGTGAGLYWCSATDTWTAVSSGGSGTVTHTGGAMTANRLVIGAGSDDVAALGSLGTTTTLLHGNAAGAPTFGAVDLTADVTGDLTLANLAQASSASKVLGRGSASGAGDFEEITLGTNLSMSGTTLNAVGGGTGGAIAVYQQVTSLTNAQILALGTTPITILDAPGTGFAVYPLHVIYNYNFSAGAYNDVTIRTRYAGDTADIATTFSNTFNQTTRRSTILPTTYVLSAQGSVASAVENKALQISSASGVTGGNAANSMRAYVTYLLVALL